MARLLSWPSGLRWNRWKWLSGPQSVGASTSTTVGDFTQTVANPFGARHVQLSFPPLRGQLARRARGMVTALHAGANAVRIGLCDWDGLSLADAGVTASEEQRRDGVPWSNAMPWGEGRNWRIGKPSVRVSSAVARGGTIIELAPEFWGHDLGMGDWVGFAPFHFGHYEVTEVLAEGKYRIWPPLRKSITTDDLVTLYPVMAMRLLSNNLPDADRGPAFVEGLSISLFEVFDYDARDYFDD